MSWFSSKKAEQGTGFNVPVQYPDGTIWYRTEKGAETAEQDGATAHPHEYYCGIHGWVSISSPCSCLPSK
jgi:hypothetical protein